MNDIGVTVDCEYVPAQSDPAAGKYLFAYTITIENRGESPAQLLNRSWRITNGAGDVREVKGPGVVGKQPRLLPGQGFRYTSAALIETPVGSMEGHYEFVADDGVASNVPIPCFTLAMPNMVH